MFTLLACAALFLGARAFTEPQIFPGEYILGLSNNGQWAVGQCDDGESINIHNLATGENWRYEGQGDNDIIRVGLDHIVSDNGVVIATRGENPYYWKDGKWTMLPVFQRDYFAVVGSVSADGSMIVGGLGNSGFSTEDIQMTVPCIWHADENGEFKEREILPYPRKDFFGLKPQYLHCVSISTDGNTIGASMTCGTGFYCIPYVYTKDAEGNWQYKELGMDIINPQNLEIMPYPGDYHGPLQPDWDVYLTDAGRAAFWAAFPAWAAEQEAAGYTDEEQAINQLYFLAEFMEGENKESYTMLLDKFMEAYNEWKPKEDAYNRFMQELARTGASFGANSERVSPDGKYLYAMAKGIVQFDVETGTHREFSRNPSISLSCITDNYSVLGVHNYGDQYFYRMAYIFPDYSLNAVTILDYWQQTGRKGIYEWMSENMLHEVEALAPDGDSIVIDEAYSIGLPISTPDMKTVSFATSAYYWVPMENYTFISYVLHTDMVDSGVDGVFASDSSIDVRSLGNGMVELDGEVASLDVYSLSGALLSRFANPSRVVSTGLAPGLYILRASSPSGCLSRKLLIN